ncbi:MAG: methyltransferase domain-containing protein [Candidatus Omnitrophota bacterium]
MCLAVDNSLWRRFAKKKITESGIDRTLGRYKSREFREILQKWSPALERKNLLKTDLCEEAFGEDELLFSLSESGSSIFALDVAADTAIRANIKQRLRGLKQKYIAADVRNLPFKDNFFDVIISSSTLDHFSSDADLIRSLLELKRVIKPGGKLVIALNNGCNLNFYLMLKLGRLFNLIPYPVQFYGIHKLRRIMNEAGFVIRNKSYIVHIISPLNSLLLLLRRFADEETVGRIAGKIICLFNRMGKNKMTNFLTGWFIALGCVKKSDREIL